MYSIMSKCIQLYQNVFSYIKMYSISSKCIQRLMTAFETVVLIL